MAAAGAEDECCWRPERTPWGRGDLLALGIWSAAILVFFWDAATLRRALFYFDITELNFAYRDFFARELRAGRFSRWCPQLYCGLPLYSESQAGYLHPLKYLLYPWLATWQAFNLDTILSVWLTGLGTYGWLRRHVRPQGALAGAAVFGLGGFVWAHLIHTSMINALASVPFVVWALEAAWERGRWRPIVLGALALACQVFAGHLQDTILTSGLVVLYALYRAATERGTRPRLATLALAAGLLGLGGMLAAVQWVPSKELLDRSPRAGGLSWDELTYGSWHPELLPALVVREAYGTRARDTDWMDGFYPYHEMDAYLGVIAIALAILGAAAYRDRWVAFWVLIAGVGSVLMLGRFTWLFDWAHLIPIFGSSRIPVRYHLWVSLAAAALAAVGVDRLARPGVVRLRATFLLVGWIVLVAIPIAIHAYLPVWTEPTRWTKPYHLARYRWLGNELAVASIRTGVLAALAATLAVCAARTASATLRRRIAWCFPLLMMADLLGAHIHDVPTVPPAYWTSPPMSALTLRQDPSFVRLFGIAAQSSGEPGFASEPVDFLSVRDTLDWSLPPIWGLATSRGETPIIPRRLVEYTDRAHPGWGRFDIEAVSHLVSGSPVSPGVEGTVRAGTAYVSRNPNAFPRVRLAGRPVYASGENDAMNRVVRLGSSLRDHLVVEDPTRPLPEYAAGIGSARIEREIPERIEIVADAATDAYLVLADTFDPGWSATVDGKPASIRAAYIAFRAVFLPKGHHTVIFEYRPAGFEVGLAISVVGSILAIVLLFWPRRVAVLASEHGENRWPKAWPAWGLAVLMTIVLSSTIQVGQTGKVSWQPRWRGSVHEFTWGAGVEAMKRNVHRPKARHTQTE